MWELVVTLQKHDGGCSWQAFHLNATVLLESLALVHLFRADHYLRLRLRLGLATSGLTVRGKFRMSNARPTRWSKVRVVSMKLRMVDEDSPLLHAACTSSFASGSQI